MRYIIRQPANDRLFGEGPSKVRLGSESSRRTVTAWTGKGDSVRSIHVLDAALSPGQNGTEEKAGQCIEAVFFLQLNLPSLLITADTSRRREFVCVDLPRDHRP